MKIIKTIEEIDNAIKDNEMTLLYFGMDSCGVCVDLLPKVEKMLEKYKNIKSYHIDARNDIKVAAEFDVFTVPVIVLYINGKETVRLARHISVIDLEEKVDRYYNMLY